MIQYYPSCNQCARYQPGYRVTCPKAFKVVGECKDFIPKCPSVFDADKRALKAVAK